jgi:hypothetical protein
MVSDWLRSLSQVSDNGGADALVRPGRTPDEGVRGSMSGSRNIRGNEFAERAQ